MKKLNFLVLAMMLSSLIWGFGFAQDAGIAELPEPRIILEEAFDEMYDESYDDLDVYVVADNELDQTTYWDYDALGDNEVMPISLDYDEDYDDMWEAYDDLDISELMRINEELGALGLDSMGVDSLLPNIGVMIATFFGAALIILPFALLGIFWLVMLIDAVAHQKKKRGLWIWLLAVLRLVPIIPEIVAIIYYFSAKRPRDKEAK